MVKKESKDFINLISNFDPKNSDQKKELENLVFEYPYFQLAHALYLKSLKIQDQFNFDLILKKTAILSPKRKLIFNWIENKENNLFKIFKKTQAEKLSYLKNRPSHANKTNQEKESNLEEKRMHFVDWVSSYNKTKINLKISPLDSKIQMIDSFLEKNPKMPKNLNKENENSILNLASKNLFDKSELMTESLAKIYVKQRKIKKALYAYKILSLKYPEKSSLFANQIKKLQKSKNQKNK